MKELIIKAMEETRRSILERLKDESEMMSQDEIDQLLDSLLEIEKVIENLKK